MQNFEVRRSQNFENDLKEYVHLKGIVDKIEKKLVQNPFSGTPLGYPWFREKKNKKFRIYYLIYEEQKVVFMITISGKKDQQKTINTVLLLLDKYREELKKII